MLDEEEFKKARELYSLGFKSVKSDRFKPLLGYYNNVTGFGEAEPHAIMHHQLARYDPLCEICYTVSVNSNWFLIFNHISSEIAAGARLPFVINTFSTDSSFSITSKYFSLTF